MIDLFLKPIKFLFFILFTQFAFGQLSNFSLNVSATNETCTANGTLSFNVSGTTTGATIVYEIYKLPNTTTPIAVLNTNTFTGLVAGTYRVIAVQSLGSLTNSVSHDVVIVNQVVLLTYQLVGEDEICGHDGKITVNVTSGNAVQYEIFQGPIIKPLQTSNVFTGLVAGQYQVRVFDNCGEGVVQTFTVQHTQANLQIQVSNSVHIIDCNSANLDLILGNLPNTVIAYPILVTITIHPPGGAASITLQTQTIVSASGIFFSQVIPFYPNQSYSYDVQAVDSCGNTYHHNGVNLYSSNIPLVSQLSLGCNHYDIFIYNAQSATLVSAPSGTPYTLPYVLGANSSGNLVLQNVSLGTYTFDTIDFCGVIRTQTITLLPSLILLYVSSDIGCDVGKADIYGGSNLGSVILVQAPSSYSNNLPQDLSSTISNGLFQLNNVPLGSYTFNLIDNCGNTSSVVVNVTIGYSETTNISVIPNCGSFNVDLHHSSNFTHIKSYWLQKYDPVTNQWFNPITGGIYSGGSLNTFNAISLINNAINYNFAFTGHFRVVCDFFSVYHCINTLYEFDFTGLPKINDVYSFSCNNGTYDALVDAIGMPPLIYRITQKDGQPFVVNNGNSYVFLGLQPATYNFQVEDACGNILNSVFEVPRPFNFAITPQGLCNGSAGSLVVPNFSILHYQWWNDNNPSVILSTTNTLQFPNFNPITAGGIYHVRVQYTGNPNSCIDFTLDYTISSTIAAPNAGLDNAIVYCGNPASPVNLNTLLLGNYDTGGTWQEITSSGMLNNNIWNATTIVAGVYQFKYKVLGQCGSFDEAIIAITIKPIPLTPAASVGPIVCDTNSLNLYATFIPNCAYSWTGPNGFTSTDQNPIINSISNLMSGVYTVNAIQDGCASGASSVTVMVNPLPQFVIESSCLNMNFMLTATPVQNSFDSSMVSYNWTGPNGFSVVGNPIQITGGERGMYYATITDANGCSATQSIDVQTTLCGIPNVISPNNDGYNDVLDLIGFDVVNLQIFNRWGRLVYEKNNYLQEWHGQNNQGNDLPTGTYFYFATLNTGEEMRGWIEVLR